MKNSFFNLAQQQFNFYNMANVCTHDLAYVRDSKHQDLKNGLLFNLRCVAESLDRKILA